MLGKVCRHWNTIVSIDRGSFSQIQIAISLTNGGYILDTQLIINVANLAQRVRAFKSAMENSVITHVISEFLENCPKLIQFIEIKYSLGFSVNHSVFP